MCQYDFDNICQNCFESSKALGGNSIHRNGDGRRIFSFVLCNQKHTEFEASLAAVSHPIPIQPEKLPNTAFCGSL